MTAPFLGNDTLVVTAITPVLDTNGDPVTDSLGVALTTTSSVTVTGGFEIDSSDETNSNVQRTELHARAWLPWGTPCDEKSRITWQGLEFEVQGPIRPWTDLDGNGDHIELNCIQWKG